MAVRAKKKTASTYLARTARFSDMGDPNYLRNGELFFLFRQKAVFTIVIWLSISKCTLLKCNRPITS